MHNVRPIFVSLLVVCCAASPHTVGANEEPSVQGLLSVAKMAGACGILDSMIQLQRTTKMVGGDEFVTRFWSVEAARLGMTVPQLIDRCNKSIEAYDKLWAAAESK